jgi:hypothetical protein
VNPGSAGEGGSSPDKAVSGQFLVTVVTPVERLAGSHQQRMRSTMQLEGDDPTLFSGFGGAWSAPAAGSSGRRPGVLACSWRRHPSPSSFQATLLYYSTFVSDHGPACQITVRVIDFHAHLVPGFYRDAAAEAGYAIMTTNGLPLLDGSGC